MQALLAYKRPSSLPGGGTDYGFEIRPMTCFNGFNQHNAFRTMTPCDSQFMSLILPQGNPALATTGYRDTGQAPWQFIALGWASELVTSKASFNEFWAQRDTISGMEWPAMALNREHVTGKYYDWNTDTNVPGKRERTPLEVELGDLLYTLSQRPKSAWNQDTFAASKAAWMIYGRNYFHYSLYDFVGAERPSGLAVAYLQVYRNMSRNMLSSNAALQAKARETSNLLFKFDTVQMRHNSPYKSYIPIISAMNHTGGDSDILSFAAGSALALQIMKFGTFSIGEFMQNSRPMTSEGLYNKGYQSQHLGNNIAARLRATNRQDPNLNFGRLSTMSTATARFAQYCDTQRIGTYGIDAYLREIENAGHALRRDVPDVVAMGRQIRELLGEFADLRVPPQPVVSPRIAGAASSFTQWAEQQAASNAVH